MAGEGFGWTQRVRGGSSKRTVRLAATLLAVLLVLCSGIALAAQDEGAESPASAELSAPPAEEPGVEVKSERTATSNTFELPDGAREARIYETPVNYRDAEGDWKPIEEGLEPAAGQALSNGANGFDLHFPAQIGSGPVRLSVGDQWIEERLLGQETEPAELQGEGASYETADHGTTFAFTSLGNGVKEDIELADPSQPSTLRFELSASAGLTPTKTEEGSIEFKDQDGNTLATLPAPVMSDSAAVPTFSSEVSFNLEADPQGEGWLLSVEANREWLSDPSRSFPVRIDPSVKVNAPTSLDCNIFNPPNESLHLCGATGWPLVGAFAKYKSSGTDEYAHSLYRFNLATIPKNSYIAKATVLLHASNAVKNTAGVELRGNVEKAWTSAATWKLYNGQQKWTTEGGDAGTIGAEVLTAVRGAQPGWWEFSSAPMAPLLSEWLTGTKANNGFLLRLTDEKIRECCIERLAEFDSSAAGNSENRPYLAVEYYPPAPATSKVVSPSEGTRTARRLKLKAAWSVAGVTGITYQYREGKTGSFQTIPAELVRKASGQAVSWPLPLSGVQEAEPLYFDAAHASSKLQQEGGPIQVRALFEGPAEVAGYSAPVEATVNRFTGGPHDATAQLGPGSVDLLTGNLSVGRSDVTIPGFGSALEFTRTFNSREAGTLGETSVLGQGWKPGTPVEEAGGADWKNVRLVNFSETIEGETFSFAYAVVTDLEGAELAFEKEGGAYLAPPDATGWSLSSEASGTRLVLADPGGNRTTFENSGGGSEYLPISVSQTGGPGNSTRMVYQLAEGKRRLSMVIAPSPAGITCTEGNATAQWGCHALTFTYLPASTWGAPDTYGQRLSKITYYAPGNGGPWEVANYSYDASGRLVAEWDPRVSPALKETYSYESTGQLHTITPPGQEPWTMEYGTADGEIANGRLINVKRATLRGSPSVGQTTIAYGVSLSGSGAPYDLSSSAIAKWGQQDLPVDATAIFPPTEVPANPPSAYTKATVYYMDAEGRSVNTATPAGAGTSGASITTAESDEFGNVTRELSAQNRLRALAQGSEAEMIARSHELETKRHFSADGTEMLEEWGPTHQVRLESGTLTQARLHTTVQYDKDWPETGVKPHLPTRETTGASIVGQGTDADQRVTETRYDWDLRKPTETIVDPGGLEIKTITLYDKNSGLPVQTRQPSNPEGGGAGTTKVIYYSAQGGSGDSACDQVPQLANLPCKITPAKQPGTPGQPELLVRRFMSYNALGEPTEVKESPGGLDPSTRRAIATYDTAGRETSKRIVGGGATIPKVETLYSSKLGFPSFQRFVCEEGSCEGFDNQQTATYYDTLGRPIEYIDADGAITRTKYDAFGRVEVVSDSKGSHTFTYDANTGLLTKVQDSALTFTGTYDADGNLVERGLPDGITAKETYNEAGEPTNLSYTKVSNCGTSCTWLEEAAERSIYGQVLAQSGTLASQQYSYDHAGRLTLAQETPTGGTCTTRAYSFEASAGKDSNRTKLITRSAVGGACNTESGGTTQNYEYDSADRLLGSGLTYDSFGRITSLPAADAGGKTLTTSYFSNDMVAEQSQGGITNAFQLDASLRQHQRVQGGGLEGTEVFHYDGPSDSPTWTELGSTWTRNIIGIGGELAATQESSGTKTLQLTNLHGDVVAKASTELSATTLLATFRFDEFGNPAQEGTPRYGWLGGKGRKTELASGVIQMGARSYVPAMGRFISTDPVAGGSASAYDYANADPVNDSDLGGTKPTSEAEAGPCTGHLHVYSPKNKNGRSGYGKFYARYRVNCRAAGYVVSVLKVTRRFEQGPGSGHVIAESSREPSNPSASHWNGEWGNWYGKRPTSFSCLNGIEYQYTYEIQVKWASVGGFFSDKEGGGPFEPGEESLTLTAQEYCGHGRY